MSRPDALQLEWFATPADATGAVVCTGVFDLLHVGHIRFLAHARERACTLVVGVEEDARVAARKGAGRPLVPERERAELLAALEAVDGVFVVRGAAHLWTAQAYAELFAPLRPAALALTVGDPAEAGKRRVAEQLAAAMIVLPRIEHRSTTGLLQRAVVVT